MGRHGLRAGEVAARSGVSRKALRPYEAMGILPSPARTDSGYRAYGHEVLALLRFKPERGRSVDRHQSRLVTLHRQDPRNWRAGGNIPVCYRV